MGKFIGRGLAAALLSLLTACGAFDFRPPQPAQLITDDTVKTSVFAARTLVTQNALTDPKEFALAGYLEVDRGCITFFDRLIAWRNSTSFAKSGISAAGATAAGILAVKAASAVTMGIVGLVTGLAVTTVESFEQFAVATAFPIETRELVFAAMRHSISEKDPRQVIDMYDARSAVGAYAQYCTYGGIATLSAQALRNGAGQTNNQAQGELTGVEKAAASIQAGGITNLNLTSAQFATIVVMGDVLTDEQWDRALAAASFTDSQKKKLIVGRKLTKDGKAVRDTLVTIAVTNRGFGALVDKQRAAILAEPTPPPPPAPQQPSAGGTTPPPAVNVAPTMPIPNPAIKIGR